MKFFISVVTSTKLSKFMRSIGQGNSNNSCLTSEPKEKPECFQKFVLLLLFFPTPPPPLPLVVSFILCLQEDSTGIFITTGGLIPVVKKTSSCPGVELKRNKCLGCIRFLCQANKNKGISFTGIVAALIKIDDFEDSVPLFL